MQRHTENKIRVKAGKEFMLENDLKMLLSDTYESLIDIAGENGVDKEKALIEFQKLFNLLIDEIQKG